MASRKSKKGKKGKTKKRSSGFGKSSMGMEITSLLAGYISGNLGGNYISGLTNTPALGIATPIAMIFLSKMLKLKTEKSISSGLIISSVNQIVKSKLLPNNDFLKLALSGSEPEYYLVDGNNFDPLAGALQEDAYNDEYSAFVVSGNNDDPLA